MIEKDKKEIKGYMKKLSDDFGRQIGVYIEDVNGKFKATNEGYKGINQKLDRMGKTLNSHTEQIGKLMVKMTSIESEVKELRADNLEMRSDVRQIKLDVKLDLDRKIDKTQFIDLEGRVRVLEKK